MLDTIHYLNHMDIQGIKLQLLHILKHTDLAADYEAQPFYTPDMQEYIRFLGTCYLPPGSGDHHSPADRRRSKRTADRASLDQPKTNRIKSASQPPERTGYLAGKGVLCLKLTHCIN